ncbi:hypothetical protein DFH06DRAFT_535848 [Mycena polygramma]|nr:hypothetical protein DFH06DRAFT_535848 [Mycena polygramma]
MHPYVSLSSLPHLPVPIRGHATAAAQGSLQGLNRVVALAQHPDVSPRQKCCFLAAIYPNLDAGGIPEIGTFDVLVPTSDVRDAVARASLALQALRSIHQILLQAFKDIWPDIGPGPSFYTRSTSNYLGWTAGALLRRSPVIWSGLSTIFRTSKVYENFFPCPINLPGLSGSGVHSMLVEAWASSLRLGQDEPSPTDYGSICLCVLAFLENYWDPPKHRDFAEILDGAGGSMEDLASLFVRHIDRILSFPERPPSEELTYLVNGIFEVASRLEDANRSDQTGRITLTPFCAALLHRGIIPSTIVLISAFCNYTEPPPMATLDKCLLLLVQILDSAEGYRHLPTALEAGLLKCLIYMADLDYRFTEAYLTAFWDEVLPSSLVYYHVLSHMERALSEAKKMAKSSNFKSSPKFAAWKKFKELATQRLEVLAQFDSPGYVTQRACENMKCNRICEKVHFRRCSGCQSAYYCSAQCQRSDWSSGGHRESCALNRSLSLNPHSSLDVKERNFLRALLNHDYKGMIKFQARMQQLQILNEQHDAKYFTVFNYANALEIGVFSVNDPEFHEVTGAARWAHDVARVVKGDGLLSLQVVVLREGGAARYFIVPLRTDTARTVEIHLNVVIGDYCIQNDVIYSTVFSGESCI